MGPEEKSTGKNFLLCLKIKEMFKEKLLFFFLPLDVILCGSHVWSQGMHSEMET